MKKFVIFCFISVLILLFAPLAVYNTGISSGQENKETEGSCVYTAQEAAEETVCVYSSKDGKNEELSMREYIIGVVAGEMPVIFEKEALAAQAAASVTLTRRKLLDGGNINSSGNKFQSYMSRDEMKKRWGDKYDEYYEKLCSAVDEVIDCSICYEGEPIVAAFHAISPGKTEDSGNVWPGSLPYLKSVESEGDKFSPGYESEVTVSEEEFARKIKEAGAVLSSDPSSWTGDEKYSSAGSLLSIKIGDREFTGSEVREIFSLRSNAFRISHGKNGFTFSVKGHGHGIGLSQYGADYYARKGMTWREITAHYYPGTVIL